jgi:hypothetical protein
VAYFSPQNKNARLHGRLYFGGGCSLARTRLCSIFPVTGKNTGNFTDFSRLIHRHPQKTRTSARFPPHSVKSAQFRNRERAGKDQAVNREFSTGISDSNLL